MKKQNLRSLIYTVALAGIISTGCTNQSKVESAAGQSDAARNIYNGDRLKSSSLAARSQVLGMQAIENGNLKLAASHIRDSLAHEENLLLRTKLAKILAQDGNQQAALSEFDQIFRTSGTGTYLTDPVVLSTYASLCDSKSRRSDADRLYSHVLGTYRPSKGQFFPPIETKVSEPDSIRAIAKLIACSRLMSYGKHEEALAFALEAKMLKPRMAQVRLVLAHSLEMSGRTDEAQVEYAEAFRIGNSKIQQVAKKSLRTTAVLVKAPDFRSKRQ